MPHPAIHWSVFLAGEGQGLPPSATAAVGHHGAQQADPKLLQGQARSRWILAKKNTGFLGAMLFKRTLRLYIDRFAMIREGFRFTGIKSGLGLITGPMYRTSK